MPPKPTGTVGTVIALNTKTGATINRNELKFSNVKAEIELQIMELFKLESERQGLSSFTYYQNDVNAVDFTILPSNGETRYLELTEAHYVNRVSKDLAPKTGKTNMYPTGNVEIFVYDFAQQLMDRISPKLKKKYPKPCDLLIYSTHWQVRPDDYVLNLVRHFLKIENPSSSFERIVFVRPVKSGEAEIHNLFPVDGVPLNGRHPDEFRHYQYTSVDLSPSAWGLIERDGKMLFILPGLEPTPKKSDR